MILTDLKNQWQEKIQESWANFKDSPTYSSLREKYDTLSPPSQKILVFGTIGLVFLVIISIPYSYLSSSSDFNQEYESLRQTTRKLLHASLIARDASSLPPSMSSSDLKNRIQGDLAGFSLTAEQITPPIDLELKSLGPSFVSSKEIQQAAVGVQIKKLNLKQIVDIAYQMQNINPGVKLAGLEVKATATDPHYFDVLFKLISFSLKSSPEENAGTSRSRFRPPPSNNNENDLENEEDEVE